MEEEDQDDDLVREADNGVQDAPPEEESKMNQENEKR